MIGHLGSGGSESLQDGEPGHTGHTGHTPAPGAGTPLSYLPDLLTSSQVSEHLQRTKWKLE